MNMRKWFGLMLVLMLAFVLAACGGDGDDDGGNSDGDNNSASSVALPQTITSEDPNFGGSLTVSYPEGWVAQDAGGAVAVANSQETLDTAQAATGAPDMGDNAVFATIQALGPQMLSFFMDEGAEMSPAAVLNATLLSGSEDEEGVEIGEVQEETLNGKSAATVVATSSGESGEGRIFGVAVEVNGGYVVVGAITALGEEDFDDEIRAIAGSIEASFDTGEEAPADATEEAAG